MRYMELPLLQLRLPGINPLHEEYALRTYSRSGAWRLHGVQVCQLRQTRSPHSVSSRSRLKVGATISDERTDSVHPTEGRVTCSTTTTPRNGLSDGFFDLFRWSTVRATPALDPKAFSARLHFFALSLPIASSTFTNHQESSKQGRGVGDDRLDQ